MEQGDLSTEEQANEASWTEMEQTLRDTSFQLYGLETHPPTQEAGQLGVAVAGRLEALKRSLDGVVSAQVDYRRAQADPDAETEGPYSARMSAEAAARQAGTELETSLTALQNVI